MPHIIQPITHDGALVRAIIHISRERYSALLAAGVEAPEAISITALIDTGATGTCIDARVISQLGITPKGTVMVHTPSTGGIPVEIEQYDVAFGLFDPKNQSKIITTLPVMASHFDGFEALIGRDILDQLLLIYDGIAGQFTVAF